MAVVCIGLFADRTVFSKVDYSLLITFAGFFIFIGNMKQIPWLSSLFQQLVIGHELLCSVAVSQVISNVPAALLLSGFTDQGASLLIGTNLGGLGTLIASMASLISYKYVARDFPGLKGKYLAHFYSHERALSGHPSSGRRSSPTERPSVVKRSFPEYKKAEAL